MVWPKDVNEMRKQIKRVVAGAAGAVMIVGLTAAVQPTEADAAEPDRLETPDSYASNLGGPGFWLGGPFIPPPSGPDRYM